MYARSSTVRGNPQRLDAGIARLRDDVALALQKLDGYLGLSILVDRDTGGSIITTAWSSLEALEGSEAEVGPLRDQVARELGGRPEVQEWEVAVLHRVRRVPEGAWARVTWTTADPGSVPQQVDFFRAGLVPEIERLPGFCGTSLLLDRERGAGVIAVVYEDRDALHASREAAVGLREGAVRRMSAHLVDVSEFEIAQAGLGVPETE